MRKVAVSVLGLVLTASTVVSCGGSSSKSESPTDTSPQTTSADTSANGGGTTSDDFSALIAEASKAKIKITYSRSNGESVTLAQDGNGKTAYLTGDSALYSDGNTTVSCTGTGADAECTQIP